MEEGASLLLASGLPHLCQQNRGDPRTRAWGWGGGAGSKAKLVRGGCLLGPWGCAAWLLPSPCRDEGGDYIPLNMQWCCLGERLRLGVEAEGRSRSITSIEAEMSVFANKALPWKSESGLPLSTL